MRMLGRNSAKRENVTGKEVHHGGEQEVREEGKAVLHRDGEIVEKAILKKGIVETAILEVEIVGEAGGTWEKNQMWLKIKHIMSSI